MKDIFFMAAEEEKFAALKFSGGGCSSFGEHGVQAR
jgi:hypothetical protein